MRSRTVLACMMAVAVAAQTLGAVAAPSRRTAKVNPSERRLAVEDAIDVALRHVRSHHARLGLVASDVSELSVSDAYRSRHNGVTHVYLEQRVRGLEVRGTGMTVNITRDGRILHLASRFTSGIRGAASGAVTLSPEQALRRAAAQLTLGRVGRTRVVESSEGAERATVLRDRNVSPSPIRARLVYQPVRDGRLRLAWNLEIEEISQLHWWNVAVDAATGRLLDKVDYVDHDDARATKAAVLRRGRSARRKPATARVKPPARAIDGSAYRVFPLPWESPNDGRRKLMNNPADLVASPWGWHDTDARRGPEFTTTQGNNAHAYVDYSGFGNAPIPLLEADGGEDLDFDFKLDLERPPHMNRDAAIANLFYWNNVTHDILYRYGFTERAGNFQVNNYKRGGVGDDYVQAEAQDHGGVNNANFATPPDGTRPRMQMYLWPNTGKRQLIDGDFDGGVIIHEYLHGVSNRLTGGPDKTDCLAGYQEREGEGWSDFYPIALTVRPGDTGRQPRGMGTYVLGEESRKDSGIRPTPYSTNKRINPATYKTIATAAAPHGVGYVWATMLWEVLWNLVDKHGFNPNPYGGWRSGGNNLALQLVTDGMKFQPCDPGFVDARDAILAADRALTDGDNQCEIWAGFAKRGLGYRASQGDPASKTDGEEDFSTHRDCRRG